jgi:hypothetical protein
MAGLGILAAAFAGLYFKFRRRMPASRDSRIDGDAAAGTTAAEEPRQNHETVPAAPAGVQLDTPAVAVDEDRDPYVEADDATHPLLPVLRAPAPPENSELSSGPAVSSRATICSGAAPSSVAAASSARAAAYEPTVNMHVDTVNMRADSTRLDYNLLDLDLTAQHVQMPSVLNEHAVVKERRTNLADVLKLAIEREPDRHDLRMKLLELYYAAASTNRRAFLDVVQKMARDRDHLQSDQWDKIAYMGRQIAAENPLFAEESAADDDLADCA